jgi:hypothetical protein
VPPLIGLALNVKLVPEQMLVALAEMLTLAVRFELTLITILFDVTVVVLTQEEVDVITQVTTSLFANVEVINAELFVPTFTPFTFH